MKDKVIEIEAVSPDEVINSMKSHEPEKIGTDETSGTTNEKCKNIYDLLEEEIMSSNIPDREKTKKLSRLLKIRGKKVNIMLTGATGSGKSSTINALFNMEIAKVGVGVDPETEIISKYELDNLIIWDTPGLGDGVENDDRITGDIIRKLSETDGEGRPLIDIVIVVLDASSKDLGTSYDLINKVLIPCLGDEASDRILIAINQSDMAMKGTHWNSENNEPDDVLKEFLKEKAKSVQKEFMKEQDLILNQSSTVQGIKRTVANSENRIT